MPDLLDRRKTDLEIQLQSLPLELKHWEGLSEEGKMFEKHYSQIRALSRQMVDLNDKVGKAWNGSSDFAAIRKAQIDAAAVQNAWNYFRGKLLMRFDERLGAYLRAADAYVWSCYEPVLTARRAASPGEPFREPPLVAFDTDVSPWAQSRRTTAVNAAAGSQANGSAEGDPALAEMPIAVMGIPWSTAEFLPNLAALAHETAHVIESDFGLADSLENALSTATRSLFLSDGWSHFWRKEIFADLFACYTAGPSFVWTLTDSIPDSPSTVKIKRRPSAGGVQWGKYPPATLRILLNLHALRTFGHGKDADAIEKYWKADYPQHAMADFEDDVKVVVPAVYEAARLPATLDYSKLTADPNQYDRIYATAVTRRSDLILKEAYNPRAIVGVSSAVHRASPKGTDQTALWLRLQKHIVLSRPAGKLGKALADDTAPARLRTDRLAGLLFSEGDDDDS